ncbi:MAG: CARDB domain-containing protein [Halolamina sp.]
MVRAGPALVALLVLTSIAPGSAVAATGTATAVGSTSLTDVSTAESDAATSAAPATGTASPTIRVDTALSLTPDTPGSIEVVQTFDLPDEVTALQVTLDTGVTVRESTGFSRSGERTWEWDGETASPTLRYGKESNRTADVSGPLGTDGSYLYADVGPWALVQIPNIGLQWRYRGTDAVSVSRSTRVAGEGAVGVDTAFLGAHTVYTRRANGQSLRLVVPEAAEMANSPDRVLSALANASREMQVGDRDQRVFAVAAPTNSIDWAVQGLQVGSHDFWVRDSQRVGDIGNAWLHEYVHTRQSFETAASGRWFTEASATWYAALLSLDEGATFADFERFLGRGASSPQADSVLAEPSTWTANAQYWKGALVLGELDRQLRLDTDRSASLQNVFRALNGRTGEVTSADIVAAVGEAGASATEDAAERFTTTSATPETWTRSAHREAFGSRPAQMRIAFDPGRDVRYTGPYRNTTADAPIRVAVGESLSFRAGVTNVGDATGAYEVVLRVADARVARANGTLAPGESTTARLRYRFDETGSYTVSVAGERVEVRVREPATPRVTEVRVDRSEVERGGTVTVTATVENQESVPGNRTVVFTRDGESVTEQVVQLDPGEQTTVSAQVRMPDGGEHRLGAGEQTVTVRVTTETPTETEEGTEPTEVPVPGFGVPAVVAAVAALVLRSVLFWRP